MQRLTTMIFSLQRHAAWVLAWGVLSAIGALLLARSELSQQREAFETNARIAHRLLSQRVVQHDAVLATLALLGVSGSKERPEQRLVSVYPQILAVERRDQDGVWADSQLNTPEAESRRLHRAALAMADLTQGRYQVLLAATPVSFLLQIDLRRMVPWSEWPMDPLTSRVRVSLDYAGQSFVLQPGGPETPGTSGWHFEFDKLLAAESQPFRVNAQRQMGWSELPWRWMLGCSLLVAALLQGMRMLVRQRHEHHRTQELLRLGQVARLNTLGELAAGMAHELNQPLTAILANTQAASRLLKDEPPDLAPIQQAMRQAVEQARRAAEVVGRLRRAVERPELAGSLQAVNLQEVTHKALYLMAPELKRHHVTCSLDLPDTGFRVLAEPVALEQIIHNLLMNAVQAMTQTPLGDRRLTVILRATTASGRLTLQDSGPGMAANVLPRIFEPFFTTRDGGLGLGLSLCETLSSGMGGSLTAHNRRPHGAEFTLSLPLAPST